MHETDLHLDPNEASDLCRALDPAALDRHGWDRAFVTVLDEVPAEDALALLVHARGAPLGAGWEAVRIHAEAGDDAGRTEDAEACAARDGFVYVVGSQFGKKSGPLVARRSWIARIAVAALDAAAAGERPPIEVARLRFGLHRAVNDALAAAAVELLPLGPRLRAAYVDATITAGAEKGKRWAGRVRSQDHPINVEAAEFRADGRMLLGLRYPTTAAGHPILVEVHDVETLFADADAVPGCGNIWVLENVGSPEAPAGFRGLDSDGDDGFEAIVGNLDAAGKSSTVLADHPGGGTAASEHVRFELPLTAGGGAVRAERVHHFGALRRIEGVALDHEGHAHYVIDEEGRVTLHTLVFE